jgi:hypothetical protein
MPIQSDCKGLLRWRGRYGFQWLKIESDRGFDIIVGYLVPAVLLRNASSKLTKVERVVFHFEVSFSVAVSFGFPGRNETPPKLP